MPCMVLAEGIAGNERTFADKNDQARAELGLTQSNFCEFERVA